MNIKELNNKIKIIFNIYKLTNTMSMISLSKMNKYYKFIECLEKLYKNTQFFLNYIFLKNKKNFCLIIVTSNKGLCGNVNNEIIKKSLNFLKLNKNIDIFTIGKKSYDFFKKKNIFIKKKILFIDNIKINNIFFSNEIINFLNKYKNIYFFSSKYIKNKIKIVKTILFFNNKIINIKKKVFNILNFINKYLNYSLKYIYIQNLYCELKSRMITMKSASDNSKKIVKNMKILKNKIRQFKVTQEMLEIINGSNL